MMLSSPFKNPGTVSLAQKFQNIKTFDRNLENRENIEIIFWNLPILMSNLVQEYHFGKVIEAKLREHIPALK